MTIDEHPDLAALDDALDRDAERRDPENLARLADDLDALATGLRDPLTAAAAMFGAAPHGAFVLLVNPDGTVRVVPIGPVDEDVNRAANWFHNFSIGAVCLDADDGSGEPLFLRAALFADSIARDQAAHEADRRSFAEVFVRDHPWVCGQCTHDRRFQTERGLNQHISRTHRS